MRSLRSRLLFWMLGSIAVLLALFGAGVYAAIRHALEAQFDASLAASAQALSANVEHDEDGTEIELDAQKLHEFQEGGPAFFQFWLASGRTLRRSPSLGRADLAPFSGTGGQARLRAVALPSGQPGRAIGIEFVPRSDEDEDGRVARAAKPTRVVLVVARERVGLDGQLHSLGWLLGGAGVAVMTLALLVAAVVVRRGLRPLDTVAAQIGDIREDELTGRIPVAHMPTELRPVVDKLNDLLGRLELAVNRERSFTADVAHELRTPVAGIRSTAEVALSDHDNAPGCREALTDVLAIAAGMQSMIESLLMLARLDAGRVELRCDRIELPQMVASCWEASAQKAGSRGVVFEARLPAGLSCTSSRSLLSLVLSSLLDNAAEYAGNGGRIWVTGQATPAAVEIAVANTGCGLAPDQAAHVFDRFWRGDSSRANTGVHCGLGLALAQRAVRALGGTIAARVDEAGVFTVRVVLPASV